MSEALLPCPFCGGSAHIERVGDRSKSTIYQCDDCCCSLETGEEWDHGRAWNRRAPSPQPQAAVDAAARLERILRLGRSMKWTRHGAPALDDENTAIALGELSQIFFQNELDRALATTEGSDNG